jgi:dihydrofolate synthase/folylpolyglutamate synthase
MDFKEAGNYINSLKVNYKEFDLKVPRELIKRMGFDPSGAPTITVAGTNGKGSTVSFASQILVEAGYNVGTYTSPHLIDIRERIKLNNKPISKNDFAELVREAKNAANGMKKKPSYFEVMTAVALKYFFEKKVDVMVLEVGMGGRLDATNVVKADVAVITGIGLDHTKFLGNTIAKIAKEKAGIIHRNSTVVVAKKNAGISDVRSRARKLRCEIIMPEFRIRNENFYGVAFDLIKPIKIPGLKTIMPGKFQAENASLATAAVLALQKCGIEIDRSAIKKGIRKTFWPARMQVMRKRPLVLVDGAHNPHGAKALSESLKKLEFRKLILVFGCLKDKNGNEMLEQYKYDEIIVTSPKSHRAYKIGELRKVFKGYEIILPVSAAIRKAMKIAGNNDLVLITGSLYTAGEALQHFRVRTV